MQEPCLWNLVDVGADVISYNLSGSGDTMYCDTGCPNAPRYKITWDSKSSYYRTDCCSRCAHNLHSTLSKHNGNLNDKVLRIRRELLLTTVRGDLIVELATRPHYRRAFYELRNARACSWCNVHCKIAAYVEPPKLGRDIYICPKSVSDISTLLRNAHQRILTKTTGQLTTASASNFLHRDIWVLIGLLCIQSTDVYRVAVSLLDAE